MTKAPDFLITPTPVLEECHRSVALATQDMLHLCVARGWMTTRSAAEGSTPRLSRSQTRLAARSPQLSPPSLAWTGWWGCSVYVCFLGLSQVVKGVAAPHGTRRVACSFSVAVAFAVGPAGHSGRVQRPGAPRGPEGVRGPGPRALYPSECVRGGGELAGAGEVTSAGWYIRG